MDRLRSKRRPRRTNARNHPVKDASVNGKAETHADVGLYRGLKEASLGLSQLRIPAQKTPYMSRKEMEITRGVYTDKSQEITYIPAFDIHGATQLYQAIFPDGRKYYVGTGTLEGHFHIIEGFEKLNHANRFVICEDYTTGYVLHRMLSEAETDDSLCVVVAFGAINLLSVSKAIRRKFSTVSIIIAGDDDRHTVMTHGVNIGRESAEEAAKSVGGVAVFPEFEPGENSYPSDLPPITPDMYKHHCQLKRDKKYSSPGNDRLGLIADLLSKDQLRALETMGRSTSFYDLCRASTGVWKKFSI